MAGDTGGGGGGGGGQAAQPTNSKSSNKTNNKYEQKTTSSMTPTFSWGGAKTAARGALNDYGSAASDLQRMIDNYQVVGFQPDQVMAHDMSRALALGAGGIFPTIIDEAMRTASGDYLYGGDGFNAAVDAAYRSQAPGILGGFGGAGRDQNFLGKEALGQTFVDAFAGQYGQERQNQLNMIGALPGLALTPASILEGIGMQQQQLQQARQDIPLQLQSQMPGIYAGITPLLQPFMGSDSKTTQKGTGQSSAVGNVNQAYYQPNQGLGFASLGGGVGGQLGGAVGKAVGGTAGSFFGPIGTIAGGALGGALGGLFG